MAPFHSITLAVLIMVAVSASVSLASATGRGLSSKQAPVRFALHEGEWAVRASRNLSAWRSQLFLQTQKFLVSKNNQNVPPAWQRFDLFLPFISCPPGRPLRRVGPPGEGGKWLCEPTYLNDPCTVISMGSNMDFGFEEAILKETPCNVVTLDCTVEGKTLNDRHSFRKLCVSGSSTAARDSRFVTYGQLVSAVGLRKVGLLKVDVESFEFPVFAEWREHTRALPEQISVEIHCYEHDNDQHPGDPQFKSHWGRGELGVSDLSLFFFHLANLGYGIVAQENNEYSWSCSEFTLLRIEAPAQH